MRLVCAVLLAIVCVRASAMAATAVTVVLQFDDSYSLESVEAMKREVASIVAESGIQVDWRLRDDVRFSDSFENLVVVHFRGACMMESASNAFEASGRVYAFTHVSDGEVLPFSEVECGKVSSSIRPQLSKRQWVERDSILGRALGRVVAHELFHMLAKSQRHADEGVTKSALSPAQLVSDKLDMAPGDLEKLKR